MNIPQSTTFDKLVELKVNKKKKEYEKYMKAYKEVTIEFFGVMLKVIDDMKKKKGKTLGEGKSLHGIKWG